jgi:hypothetical protein
VGRASAAVREQELSPVYCWRRRAKALTEKIKAEVNAQLQPDPVNKPSRYKLAVQVHIGAMEVRIHCNAGCDSVTRVAAAARPRRRD